MRKIIFLLLFVIFLSACQGNQLSLPNDRSFLLVSHVKDDVLTFLNMDDFTVLKETPFSYQIHTVEIVDDDKMLFTGKLEEAVYMLDLQTGEIESLYEFGQGILSLLFDENERILYLTDAKTDSVLVFDYDHRKIVAVIKVGSYPVDLEMNDERTELYVLASDANEIYVVSLEEQKVVNTISTMEGSTTLFFDGSYLWVGGHGMYRDLNEFIYLYDVKKGEMVERLKVGSMPIFFHEMEDLQYIAVLCHGSHELYVIDRNSYDVVTKLEAGMNPYYAISNEQYLFISGMDSHDVTIIDKDTLEIVDVVDVKDGPYAMVIGGQ